VNESVYNTFAPQLVERGYFPLPIAPGSKAPHRYVPSENRFELFSGWSERPEPLTTPQPNAGIGVRMGKGIVALTMMTRRRLDRAQARLLRDKITWAKRAMTARFGVPLRLVFIDTLTSVSGIEDHDDTGEGAAFMNFCADLAKEFEIFIIINDHFGKNIEAGTRGTTAKEARADAVLAVIGKPDQSVEEPRKLRWRKLRNAVSGREIQFRLRSVNLEIGGIDVPTAVVEFLLDTEGRAADHSPRRKPLSDDQRVALNVLADCIKRAPAPVPDGHEPLGVQGAAVDAWRDAWEGYQVAIHGRDTGHAVRFRKAWGRLLSSLKLVGAISIERGVVWSPSSFTG
jgi:hypothetical protein